MELQVPDGNFIAIVHVHVNVRRGRLAVHDDFGAGEFLKVNAGGAVVRMRVGVDHGFESKPIVREKREVTVDLFPNRVDQDCHRVLFAADEIGFALAAVEFTENH